MTNKRFGWHSGNLECRDVTANGDVTISGSITFGDAAVDTFTINGPMTSLATTANGISMAGVYSTAGINITGTVGTGVSVNKTANTAGTLKVHCHQMAATTGDSPNQYANEFKGEFLATSGTMDGIASHFHMAGTGTGIMRSVLGVAYLDTGKTLSGTDYNTGSWLAGGVFSATSAGVINGVGVVVAGVVGQIGSCQGGTLTACKYMTSVMASSARLTALSSGDSSLLLCHVSDTVGSQAVTYGIQMVTAGLVTTGISIGSCISSAISITGTNSKGISFACTSTDNVVDFTGCTYVPTGSDGPCLLRAGSYAAPLTNTSVSQSGLLRFYMSTDADGSSYDRAIFSCLKTSGAKGIITTSGLAEVHTNSVGPLNVKGCEFVCHLFDTGAHLPASAIMYGGWFKVAAIDGSTIDSTAKVAPLWLDNQLSGANASNCEEYTIHSTTGGTQPRAWASFETTSSGWKQLLYFDETMAAAQPFVATGCNVTVASVPYLKVLVNATQYGIPLIAI